MLTMILQRLRSNQQNSVGTLTCRSRSFMALEGAAIPMRRKVSQRVPPGQYRVGELYNSLVIDNPWHHFEIVTHDPGDGDVLIGLSLSNDNKMHECQEAMDILLPMVSRALNEKQQVFLEIRNEASQ